MPFLHRIDPIALDLGTWNLPLLGSVHPQVHWYGVMYLLGFIVAWWLGRRRVRAGRLPGVDDNGFGDLMFYAMLGVVLGGRVGYILFYDFGAFIANPLMIFRVWEGGMSFHGGLLGVLVAGWWWSRRQRLHFFDTVDFVAPLVPAGLGFGRLGNYIGRVPDRLRGLSLRRCLRVFELLGLLRRNTGIGLDADKLSVHYVVGIFDAHQFKLALFDN